MLPRGLAIGLYIVLLLLAPPLAFGQTPSEDEVPRALSEQLHDEEERNPPGGRRAPASSTTQLPANVNVAVTAYADCFDWIDAGQPVLYVETVPFKDYVKDVLRNEWLQSWHPEALKAGAIAAKIYGWRKINVGARYYLKDMHNLDLYPDVVDNTCDQRYIKNSRVASTNDAVDATWNFRLIKNGNLLQGYYLATESQCLQSPYQPCMPQWGTQYRAQEGKTWQEIVQQYYGPVEISLVYLPDVPVSYTFYDHIKSLVDDGVVSGYGDGNFRPDQLVTRGEMAKFIKVSMGLSTTTTCAPFEDVPSSHTFYNEILTLRCLGISNGANNRFFPDVTINRAEAMKFVMNALRNKKNDPMYGYYGASDQRFSDIPSTYPFYEYIMAASDPGMAVVSGYQNGTFQPQAFTTRGAMSKMIDNARKK